MKIVVAGDYCQRLRVDKYVANKRFDILFDEIRTTVECADYQIVNLEFPIVTEGGMPHPINKCGPHLFGSKASIDALKYAGFSCCTLANNHILDQGEECCLETMGLLKKAGFDTVGVGKNIEEASKILFKNINGETIAIINCCETEFSIATENTAGANPINIINQYAKIIEARRNADYVLVIVHGGHEFFQFPSIRMQDTYRFFIDIGADAVVNHHQHCYSGYEFYKGKPIVYGIGNFLFDNDSEVDRSWYQGYLVKLDFQHKSTKLEVFPYEQCYEFIGIHLMDEKTEKQFYDNLNEMNRIIVDRQSLKQELDAYYDKSSKEELLLMEPYTDTILYQFYKRGLLPKFFKGKKKLMIENHIVCESHRDKLIYALKKEQ